MLINVIVKIRMTKQEVERDLMPTLTPPPGGYFYWWENLLMTKFPLPDGGQGETPVMLWKDDMVVEVVDEEDIYKLPTDDDDCDCPLCSGKLESDLRKILDYLDQD